MINAFVLQLAFSGLIGWISQSWIKSFGGISLAILPVILSLFAQATHIMGFVAGKVSMSQCMSSQCFAVLVGIAFPSLVRTAVSSVYPETPSRMFAYSGIALGVLAVYSILNYKNGIVYFNKFKYFIFLYPLLIAGYIFI